MRLGSAVDPDVWNTAAKRLRRTSVSTSTISPVMQYDRQQFHATQTHGTSMPAASRRQTGPGAYIVAVAMSPLTASHAAHSCV